MSIPSHEPAEIKRRYGAVIVGAVGILLVAVLMANQLQGIDIDDTSTPVSELSIGECFQYPGDGVVPKRVETVDCSQSHYGEVVGTTSAGNNDACVGLFEDYTGTANYWESDLILGFIPIDDSSMHCYLYGPEDFAGSRRA